MVRRFLSVAVLAALLTAGTGCGGSSAKPAGQQGGDDQKPAPVGKGAGNQLPAPPPPSPPPK